MCSPAGLDLYRLRAVGLPGGPGGLECRACGRPEKGSSIPKSDLRDAWFSMTCDSSDPRERADLLRLFQYAAGDDKLVDDSFELFREPVVHQAIDMQHAMHMDSFAATIKVFGFHEEVTMNNGPFHYVNGSHRHTESKLRLIHDLVRDDDEFVICASPRIYPSHQREYGIVATPMVVPEGSVVIADTNGFHFRGKGTPGTRRDFWTTRWKNIEWSHRDIPRFSAFRQNQ